MSEHNCPNCGAVIHDCICDYCGTVFPSSTFDFQGKRCMLITVDDDGNVHAMGIRVHSVEYKAPEPYYTMDAVYYDFRSDEVAIEGIVDDLPSTSHGLRELGRILSERFCNET